MSDLTFATNPSGRVPLAAQALRNGNSCTTGARNATACTRSTCWVTWYGSGTPPVLAATRRAESIPVATDSLHHEVYDMPSGNFLALSTELREFDNYPSSETDPAAPRETTHVVGGVLVEFTPDGQIVRELKLFDLLDPYRIGYDSLGTGFWRELYGAVVEGDSRDWLHDNGSFTTSGTTRPS